MKINREWHLANKMPKNPTREQQLEWHAGHTANCSCREMPEWIRLELEAREKLGPTLRSLK